jgi:hypothetical protein
MRAIGKIANFLVGVFETLLFGVLRGVGFVIGVICLVLVFAQFWSMIDGSHLGTLRSIAGIVGLTFAVIMTLSAIGEFLNPLELKPFMDSDEGATKATRADLRKAGLIRRR